MLKIPASMLLWTALLVTPIDSGAPPNKCDFNLDSNQIVCYVSDQDSDHRDEDDGSEEPDSSPPGCYLEEPFRQLPCSGPLGYWSKSLQCYIRLADSQPPPSHPAWDGNYPEGAIYICQTPGGAIGQPDTGYRLLWLPEPPEIVVINPEELAYEALTAMQLAPIQMGTAPFPDGAGTGLIGVPVWMWVEDPSPRTFGPNTRSASAGSVTVTVTAAVETIEWSMGDGTTVTCTSAGTQWSPANAGDPSPTCGHVYDTSATFDVTATSNWIAQWQSNTGVSGTIDVQLDDTVSLTIAQARSDLVDR